MALYHFHVTQIKRSAGQSAVACAAYRAGEKLYSEYYAAIWNAVEKAERNKKAQLACSFNIALQNEFSLEENIALAKQFISEQLVRQGMIADFAVHQPDKKDGGIPNPHFHILCPI